MGKKIYFSDKIVLFFFGNEKNKFLSTHSLNSMMCYWVQNVMETVIEFYCWDNSM